MRTPIGIRFSDACYFKVTKGYKIGYELAQHYLQLQLAGGSTRVRLARGLGKTADKKFALKYPPKKYNAPLPLNPLKLKDLQSFVPDLVPAQFLREYWNTILQSSPADINQNDDEDLALNFDRAFDYN